MSLNTNGANELVQLNGSGQLPALDGSLLTNLNGANITTGTIPGSALVSGSVTGTQIASSVALAGSPTAPTAAAGTDTTQIATTAFVTQAVGSAVSCANVRLNYVGATSVVLIPCNGNQININGTLYVVGSGGVSLSNAGLSAATLYYIYVYDNSGTLTLEASTTGHTVNAATGLPQKSGDASRLFVGWVYTDGSSQFVDAPNNRTVVSCFNRRLKDVTSAQLTFLTTSSNSFVEISSTGRIGFIATGDEAISVAATGIWDMTGGANNWVSLNFGIDSATPAGVESRMSNSVIGDEYEGTILYSSTPSEGYHYVTMLYRISGAGTGRIIQMTATGAMMG